MEVFTKGKREAGHYPEKVQFWHFFCIIKLEPIDNINEIAF
jgi:hypothetical protein